MFIFIIGFIFILLMCYFKKKKDFVENLIVSPTKLYSLNNSKSKNICTFNNTPSKNYKTFINIDQYLSIKNLTASLDLVGYKICIKLDKVNLTSNCNPDNNKITSNIIDEKESKGFYINNLDINFNSLLQEVTNPDKDVDLDYNYECLGDKCWYNATIINHLLINEPNIPNLNVHKIGWYNNLLSLQTRWIVLSEYDIRVPVSNYSINFSMFNDDTSTTSKDTSSTSKDTSSTNKNTSSANQNLFYQKTNILSQPSVKNNLNNPNISTNKINIPNCLDPLEKNYLGSLYCNKNKDCYKYGSYICNRGLCKNNYLNINLEKII